MTAFCGYFDRRQNSDSPEAHSLLLDARDRSRKYLSRDSQHKLHEYTDSCMFLIGFDNGAWRQGGFTPINRPGVAWVSGNPLIPAEDQVSNDPDESVRQIAMALGNHNLVALSRTAGNFSAAYWSKSEMQLKLCADKLALRPLFVYLDENFCYFASSIRVLRSILPQELELDETGLAQFILLAQNLGCRTIYRNVEVLAPGTLLEICTKTAVRTPYFCWNTIPAANDNLEKSSAELSRLFINATRRRTQGRNKVEAFLTGGMDSRSVVAALLDCGLKVRAFNYSYPNSADDILGRMLAEELEVDYVCYHSNPQDRLKINADYFALNAKSHFHRVLDDGQSTGRLIWSGDGGSVGLGHVYMTKENVALAQNPISENVISRLFPSINQAGSRLINRSLSKKLCNLAMTSMLEHWKSINPMQPSRRLFMYYLLNDQMRHLYHHFEQIDLSNIEFEMPFFDMEFLSYVVSLPIDQFLGHKLYNFWIKNFSAPIYKTPWQSYPGHEPCPLALPSNVLSQWETNWYGGKVGAEVAQTVITTLLKDQNSQTWKYLDRKWLYALKAANTLRIRRYNYESEFARRIYEEISGNLVFELPNGEEFSG